MEACSSEKSYGSEEASSAPFFLSAAFAATAVGNASEVDGFLLAAPPRLSKGPVVEKWQDGFLEDWMHSVRSLLWHEEVRVQRARLRVIMAAGRVRDMVHAIIFVV